MECSAAKHGGRCGSALPVQDEDRPRGPWGLVIMTLLAGYLLFAHGCHGDEDNELVAQGKETPAPISAAPPSASDAGGA